MMTKSLPSPLEQIERFLKSRRIQTNAIAFYNDPNFAAAEQQDPSFLEYYAVFVRLRKRDAAYDALVRSIVPRAAAALAEQIQCDGQKGVCIDASLMLMKMLELQGIWNYAARGGLTIHAPDLPIPTYFWPIDVKPAAGHVWLVAPPFEIVDVSLASQSYFRGEETLLPPFLIAEEGRRITPEATDYCSSEVLLKARRADGSLPLNAHHLLCPDLKRTIDYFPSYEVLSGTTKLHYCAAGVTASDAPSLQAIKSRRWNGLLADELYEQVIKPALSARQ